MRERAYSLCLKGLTLLATFAVLSCASSGNKFKKEYARVWQETIKSDAWKVSVKQSQNSKNLEDLNFYSSSEDVVLNDDSNSNVINDYYFLEKYDKFVSDAYFKIIAEAEKSDRRLKEEYQRLYLEKEEAGDNADRSIKGSLVLVSKKYEAHKEMLEGLKSWNILSEYGSNDLEFFQAENKNKVSEMFENGQSEEVIVNFLVYKLADLYHFDR